MTNKIIIAGNIAGSGKDTVADYIVSEYGYGKTFFAEGIYDIAYDLFNMKQKDRKLLQSIGEKMREIDGLVWVNKTIKKSKELIPKNNGVIISDLRRENEYISAVKAGFLPIRIVCDRDIAIKRIIDRDGVCDESLLDNESENGTRHIPMLEIHNNSTIESLYSHIDNLMKKDYAEYIKDLQSKL